MSTHRVLLVDFDDTTKPGRLALATGDFISIVERLHNDIVEGNLLGYQYPAVRRFPEDQGFLIQSAVVEGRKIYGEIEPCGPLGPKVQQLIDEGRLGLQWLGVSVSDSTPAAESETFLAFTGWVFYDPAETANLPTEFAAALEEE